MQYTEIMVHYGELSTKGRSRKDFIGRLAGNVGKVPADLEDVRIYPKYDRVHIVSSGTPFKEVDRRLKKVFGIQTYSPVIRTEKTLETVKKTALEIMQAVYKPGVTFKINTRRAGHRPEYDTNQPNLMMGGYLFDNLLNPKVEMKHPDVVLRLEIHQDAVYIPNQLLHGPGGMPVSTAGKAVMMFSGGVDSPIVSYLALKRGIDIEMTHFFSPPYTSDKALTKAKKLTSILANYCGKTTLIVVPFARIQEATKEKLPEGYLMTTQRRFMLRLADMVREKHKRLAIFNDESVGQAVSQTLESMAAINDVITTPVIRPAATMDKTGIIRLAEEIGTFDLSVMPFGYCYTIFALPCPKARPKIEKITEYKKRLDVEGLLQRAMGDVETSTIKPNEKFIDGQTAGQDLL